MIPKIIHCIWLSGEKKDEVYETCISTWKKHMPEYEIIEWNLEKFPANSVPWVQDAVACKKWAYADRQHGIRDDIDPLQLRRDLS